MKLQYFILAMLCPLLSMCQTIQLKGKVVNEDGEVVVGAVVEIVNGEWSMVNGEKTRVTDEKGEFLFTDAKVSDTIIVSAVGYETAREVNNARGQVTITLKRDVRFIEEVVVSTGYEQIRRERTTGSYATVDNRLLNRSVSSDILSRLQGVVPGLVFDKNAGNRTGIAIRGISSYFASSQPLLVVDNFPFNGDINTINPSDIDNITVLKDAAAASIWGAAAGNGVIVITTKSGSLSKTPKVSASSSFTIAAKPNFFYYPTMTTADFIKTERLLFDQGYYNSAINNTSSRPVLSPVVELLLLQRNGSIPAAIADARIDSLQAFDVRRDIQDHFYQQAVDRRHAVSLEGGGAGMRYYLGLGYDNNILATPGNINNRYTVTLKNQFRPTSKLSLQTTILYAQSNRSTHNLDGNSVSTGGGKGTLYPYARLVDETGNAMVIPRDYRLGYIDTAGRSLLLDWKYRPLDELKYANNANRLQSVTMNLMGSYQLLNWLSAEIRYQYTRQSNAIANYYSTQTYFTRNLINRFTQLSGTTVKYILPMGGILDVSDAALDEHGGRVQLNLNRNWGSSQRLSFLGGAEIRQGHSASHSSRAYGYDDNFLTYNNIDYLNQYPIYGSLSSAQRIASGIGYGDVTNRFVSLFSTGSYNLHDRYTVTASARKDASNLFGVRTNQKAVPLWSTGVAWSIAHEKFYGIKLLPLLKLRASYGYSGNVDNSRSAFAVIEYSTAPDPLTNQPFATIPAPPNPELRWEKVGILNLGIDFGFINNRISGSIEYYRKKANDLLASAPTDPTTGFTSLVLNSAVIKGRGIELQLQTINTTGIVKWSSVLLFSYTRNILDRYLPAIGTARSYAGAGTTFNPAVGKDAYALFSYRWAGLDPLTGEPQGYLNGQVSKNYTAIRNESLGSLVYHGSAAPIYSGAFRNTISWNQFSVSANIIFKLGYWFRRSSINYSSLASSWTTHSDYAMRWQKPGDEVHTSVPAFIYPLNSVRDEFYSFSEVLAERADHVRLKDIRLSYTYSDSATKLKWLKGGSVFLYADNIGLLWKANKHGLDPDYFSSGLPAPRSISMGINVAF